MEDSQDWQPLTKRDDLLEHASTYGVEEVWANDIYIVEVWPSPKPSAYAFRLQVKRKDKAAIHSWDDLQQIKNEVAGPDKTAVEVYPPEDEVTDTSNIYHLWIIPHDCRLPFSLMPQMDNE